MAFFAKVGKTVAAFLIPTVAVGSGMGTFLTIMGLLSLASISSSATVIGLPAGAIFAGLALTLGVFAGIAALVTSGRPIWNKLSNLGQRLDNKIQYRKTRKKFYIDEVSDDLKETDHILNDATQQINDLHHNISEIKQRFKLRVKNDPENKPYIGASIFTELKQYKMQINCKLENDLSTVSTNTIRHQLNHADEILKNASAKLRDNKTSDSIFRDIDKQQVDRIRDMRTKIAELYKNATSLTHNIKSIKEDIAKKYFPPPTNIETTNTLCVHFISKKTQTRENASEEHLNNMQCSSRFFSARVISQKDDLVEVEACPQAFKDQSVFWRI